MTQRIEKDFLFDTAIHFENKSIGLVGGNVAGCCSYVYLTNNGGLTWEQIGRFYAGSNYVNLMSDGFGVLGLYGDDNSKNIVLLLNFQDKFLILSILFS